MSTGINIHESNYSDFYLMTLKQTYKLDLILTLSPLMMTFEFQGHQAPEVIKLFSCSTKLSIIFIIHINVKMPTSVGILTFICNDKYNIGEFESKKSLYFSAYQFLWKVEIPCSVELSIKKFIT